jgi:hypothetical protein
VTDPSQETASEPEPTLREAIRGFAEIIRSHPEVRAAFHGYGPSRIWWRVVLALHGKPAQLSVSPERRAGLVARGFEVYGWVFRGLAVMLWIALIVLCLLPAGIGSVSFSLVTAGVVPSSLYLWVASGLLFAGARAYRIGRSDAASYLVLGLVMIIVFLCMALVIASAVLHSSGVVSLWVNAGILACLIAFGVGSYVLELNYVLVTRRPRPEEP